MKDRLKIELNHWGSSLRAGAFVEVAYRSDLLTKLVWSEMAKMARKDKVGGAKRRYNMGRLLGWV